MKDTVDAFILIGGKSTRLGRDKAIEKLGGKSLASRAIETVRDGLSTDRITLVAGNSTQFAIDALGADVPFILDLHENRGPLGGLHAALAYATTPWIFVLACDYPFVSPQLLRLIAETRDETAGAVVPRQSDGRLQPLCAFYNVAAAMPVVETTILRPRVPPPMHEIVKELKPRIIRFQDYSHLEGAEDFFLNVNTVNDLENARQRSAR
jgi:molybdenum cofactor guanylyltransferase